MKGDKRALHLLSLSTLERKRERVRVVVVLYCSWPFITKECALGSKDEGFDSRYNFTIEFATLNTLRSDVGRIADGSVSGVRLNKF